MYLVVDWEKERERVSVYVCVCVRERERERKRVRVCYRQGITKHCLITKERRKIPLLIKYLYL